MLPAKRSFLYVGVAVVFAVHNGEEALRASAMLTFLQTDSPGFLRAFYSNAVPGKLRLGLLLLTLVGFACAWLAARADMAGASSYMMLVFGSVLVLNAIAHVVLSAMARSLMPGLLTAVGLCLPGAIVLFVRAARERWLSAGAAATVPLVAAVLHGPVLAGFLRITALAS